MAFSFSLQRIRIEGIRNDAWFKNNYVRNRSGEDEEVSLDDVNAVFNDIEVGFVWTQVSLCISKVSSTYVIFFLFFIV